MVEDDRNGLELTLKAFKKQRKQNPKERQARPGSTNSCQVFYDGKRPWIFSSAPKFAHRVNDDTRPILVLLYLKRPKIDGTGRAPTDQGGQRTRSVSVGY